MTVPREDIDAKVREAHRAIDEVDVVLHRVRVAIDEVSEAIRAAQERQVR